MPQLCAGSVPCDALQCLTFQQFRCQDNFLSLNIITAELLIFFQMNVYCQHFIYCMYNTTDNCPLFLVTAQLDDIGFLSLL